MDTSFMRKLFGCLPEQGGVSADQIESCLPQIDALEPKIPPLRLSLSQRRYLSTFLFNEGLCLVEAVIEGLGRRGGLFPEVPVLPADLDSGLGRAFLWLSVRDQLASLAARADEHYMLERALTVRSALEVLRHWRADQRRRYKTAADSLRYLALEPAEWLVQRWIKHRTGR